MPTTDDPPAAVTGRGNRTARAAVFRALHERSGAFVIPNPWDAGTARLLAASGFEALATTSAGLAFSLGRRDGYAGREMTLANSRAIAEATDLPVTGDLENGFGPTADDVAETIRLAAEAGLVGGSIEDSTDDRSAPILPLAQAVERVAGAAAAAAAVPGGFMLTARAENFLHGRRDLDDTIRRLKAFEQAGADVVYAPGLPDLDAVGRVCRAVSCPVNVLAGGIVDLTVKALIEAGAKRISLGSALSRAAIGAVLRAAQELLGPGTFGFTNDAPSFTELNDLMQR